MVMYHCEVCGSDFMFPEIKYVAENLDGEHGIEKRAIARCPQCGSEEIEVIDK